MIYATHQADAYETPAQLDTAIISRAAGFLRCSWKGSSICEVTKYMVNDLTMSGRFEAIDRDETKGQVVIEDSLTGITYHVSANGGVY